MSLSKVEGKSYDSHHQGGQGSRWAERSPPGDRRNRTIRKSSPEIFWDDGKDGRGGQTDVPRGDYSYGPDETEMVGKGYTSLQKEG